MECSQKDFGEEVIGRQMAKFLSFLWLSNIPLCVCVYVCVCTHTYIPRLYPSVDGHLGCFYTLAIVNNALMHTGVLAIPLLGIYQQKIKTLIHNT